MLLGCDKAKVWGVQSVGTQVGRSDYLADLTIDGRGGLGHESIDDAGTSRLPVVVVLEVLLLEENPASLSPLVFLGRGDVVHPHIVVAHRQVRRLVAR